MILDYTLDNSLRFNKLYWLTRVSADLLTIKIAQIWQADYLMQLPRVIEKARSKLTFTVKRGF